MKALRFHGKWALLLLVLVSVLFSLAGPFAMAAAVDEEGEHHGGGWADTVARVLNFSILVGALVYLLRKPLGEFLDAKTQQVRGDLADAAEKTRRAEAERNEAEARLAGLDEEVAEVRAKGIAEAEAERERILKAAEQEAARLVEGAKKQIDAEVEIARRKITARAAELAVDLARKRVTESIENADQEALIERGLENLKEIR